MDRYILNQRLTEINIYLTMHCYKAYMLSRVWFIDLTCVTTHTCKENQKQNRPSNYWAFILRLRRCSLKKRSDLNSFKLLFKSLQVNKRVVYSINPMHNFIGLYRRQFHADDYIGRSHGYVCTSTRQIYSVYICTVSGQPLAKNLTCKFTRKPAVEYVKNLLSDAVYVFTGPD